MLTVPDSWVSGIWIDGGRRKRRGKKKDGGGGGCSCNGSIVSPHTRLLLPGDSSRHALRWETDGGKQISLGARREMEGGGGKWIGKKSGRARIKLWKQRI